MIATVWHALAEPWQQGILRNSLLEVILLGAASGPLACWVVLSGLSYSAESLAHGLFPGLVLAALVGIPVVLGGAIGVVVAALAIALAGRVPAVGPDNAVAVVITSLFGLGALLALSPASPPGIQELLFGNVLGADGTDLALAAGLLVLVAVVLRVMHPRLLAVGFDRSSAPGMGASPLLADAVLLLLLALAVTVAVTALGNLLVVAVLVAPGATARLLARRMGTMLLLAAALAAAGGVGGLYLSYYASIAAGAAVAGTMVALYLAVAAARSRAGRVRVATVSP
jgi:ABC-type Mn2+/Zn2+ transport system permease subunit